MTVSPLLPPSGEPFRVFVGYDPREHEAYVVCCRSLLRRSSVPLDVRPVHQPDLRVAGLYWRARMPTESTEFSFTRFLTPYLAGYRGWALFVDCTSSPTSNVADLLASPTSPTSSPASPPGMRRASPSPASSTSTSKPRPPRWTTPSRPCTRARTGRPCLRPPEERRRAHAGGRQHPDGRLPPPLRLARRRRDRGAAVNGSWGGSIWGRAGAGRQERGERARDRWSKRARARVRKRAAARGKIFGRSTGST